MKRQYKNKQNKNLSEDEESVLVEYRKECKMKKETAWYSKEKNFFSKQKHTKNFCFREI